MAKKLNPDEASKIMLNAGFIVMDEYPGANKPWKCQCVNCGKISNPSVHSVKSYKTQCAFCSNVRVDENDAIQTMMSKNLRPLDKYPGSSKRWKCECLVCGNIVFPRHSFVKQGKGGCIHCANSERSKTLISRSFLKVENKVKDFNLIMTSEFKGARYNVKFKCNVCNREFERKPMSFIRGKFGCPYCSGYLIDDETALKKFLESGYKPIGIRPQAGFGKWKSIHIKCGRIVYPTLSNINQGYGACRYCAQFGINLNEPGYLYLMVNSELNSYKVGIGGKLQKKDRIVHHQYFGWELLKKWDFVKGEYALSIESKFFDHVRNNLQIPIHLTKVFMKQGGWTETISMDSISVNEIEKIINEEISKLIEKS